MLGDETVLVECGPMRMFIDASVNGERHPGIEQEAARKSVDFLTEVATARHELNRPSVLIDREPVLPVVREMWKACRLIESTDLTPMAAVAGSIADATADYLATLGATRVIVNNGGDIAVRLSDPGSISIGIRSDINSRTVTSKLQIYRDDNVGGICTSGLGGRSFTRGIASAAVVFASRCSLADAAATEIANHAAIDSPKIRKIKAKHLDPDSDIKNIEVTLRVGKLNEQEIREAISNGLTRAGQLTEKGFIFGAFLQVCHLSGTCGAIMARLEPVNIEQ